MTPALREALRRSRDSNLPDLTHEEMSTILMNELLDVLDRLGDPPANRDQA